MFHPTRIQRLSCIIFLSCSFFILEIVIGFKQHSLALVADAFHVSSDLIGFVVALVAIYKAEGSSASRSFSYGYQRAELLGAFFNGVFLLALGVSILLQTIERLINPEVVTDPKLVIIVGGIGLGLNLCSALIVNEHGHDHSDGKKNDDHDLRPTGSRDKHTGHAHTTMRGATKTRDLGLLGVAVHLIGDGINNIAVMVSAGIILATGFYRADPLASLFVGCMIIATSYPLVTRSGRFLLESAPEEIDMEGVEEDVKRVDGVDGVHDMHVWSLTQSKRIATIHVATRTDSLKAFMRSARDISECLHHWGIHNLVLQPELIPEGLSVPASSETQPAVPGGISKPGPTCQLRCTTDASCAEGACCT